MSQESHVYDLGEIALEAPRVAASAAAATHGAGPRPVAPTMVSRAARAAIPTTSYGSSLSLFAPGAGQMATGGGAVGVAYLSVAALLGTLAWATLGNLDRLWPTLDVLGAPPEAAVWSLGVLFGAFGLLHVSSVASAVRTDALPPHRWVSALASFLVPGWGQVLNGDRGRAAVFVSGLWLVAISWILASPFVQSMLTDRALFLPEPLALLTSAAARFTIPAVLWTLAVYDAFARGRDDA